MATRRKELIVIAAVALAVTGGSAAFAVWTNGGSGDGAAETGVVEPVTLSPGTPGSPIYPGASVDVEVTVSNPNDGSLKIGSIALDTSQGTAGFSVDAGHASCDVSALSFTTQTNGGDGWDLPPRVGFVDGTVDITLPNALTMAASADNACQGATFTVYLESGSG